jgi:hypothetical protein
MSVSWITGLYNNTDRTFYMWARDQMYLGVFKDQSGREVGKNDNGEAVRIGPRAQLTAEWCGIPWYADERHFRALSTHSGDRSRALLMWQSAKENSDGITLINGQSMREIARITFGKDTDHRYVVIIDENDGQIEASLELRNTDDTRQQIENLVKKVVTDWYEDSRELRKEAGKAIIGAAVGG